VFRDLEIRQFAEEHLSNMEALFDGIHIRLSRRTKLEPVAIGGAFTPDDNVPSSGAHYIKAKFTVKTKERSTTLLPPCVTVEEARLRRLTVFLTIIRYTNES
jgi:hypothetical protein